MSGNDERITNWKKDHRDDGSTFAPHEYYNETFQSTNNRLHLAGEASSLIRIRSSLVVGSYAAGRVRGQGY